MRAPDVWGQVVMEEPTGGPPQIVGLGAHHINGVRAARDDAGRVIAVGVQWVGDDGRLAGLAMDLPNALYLLNCLRAMQLELGIDLPDDPRPQ